MRMKCFKIVSLLLISCSLTACVGAFIAGAALGGIIVYEGRTAQTKANDLKLTSSASQQLAQYPQFTKNSHIVISAYDGIVLLAGQTPTEQLKQHAEKLVRQRHGIRRLHNEITISGPTSSMTQSGDAWITAKIKTKLLSNTTLDTSQIKVVTENGTVYLLGKVTKKQSLIAANMARSVVGVQKVVTLFEYLQ